MSIKSSRSRDAINLPSSLWCGRLFVEANGIDVVPKLLNPPNVLELRPIEVYWAISKRICKKIGSVAQDITSFKAKWKRASKKVTKETV